VKEKILPDIYCFVKSIWQKRSEKIYFKKSWAFYVGFDILLKIRLIKTCLANWIKENKNDKSQGIFAELHNGGKFICERRL